MRPVVALWGACAKSWADISVSGDKTLHFEEKKTKREEKKNDFPAAVR